MEGQGPRPQATPYASYYSVYVMPQELTKGPIGMTTWGAAALNYQAGEYRQALEGFRETLKKKEMPAELVHFFLGQTHLALGEAKEAISAFERVLESENDLHVEARWYGALAMLMNGEKDRARKNLEQLVAARAYNAGNAQQLLTRISATG